MDDSRKRDLMTNADKKALTVMLVEDDRTQRTLISEIVSRLGCTVVTAVDGKEALIRIAQEPCDLVLMDIEMPGMDGTKTARMMTAMAGRGEISAIPIIALTGSSRNLMRENCRAAGMEEVMMKASTPGEWSAALYELLNRWFPKATLATPHERTA
jgi:CheY-like chemotaxis protein